MANQAATPPVEIPIIRLCSIVRLSSQKYAEINPEFVQQEGIKLAEYWKVKKNDTDFHKLKFNKDYDNPLILIQGWNKIKEFHALPDNVEIELDYLGDNIFDIFQINEINETARVPSFHSRSLIPTLTANFEIELTPLNIDVQKLRIDMEFASFLDKYDVSWVYFCGDNKEKWSMAVLNLGCVQKMKFGYHWDEFCQSQKFKPGDMIRFKSATTMF
ncbi:hypothetical protein QL285_026701 [Trifolium repens]|nr:hypothetical protein QL285_026701 [Trifolium repens]